MSSVSTPARLSTEGVLESFINANYDCIGNVANIHQAKVILLGEDHSIDRHIQINAMVINSLNDGSDKDIALLEHPRGLKTLCNQGTYVNQAIATEGWDNRSLLPTGIIWCYARNCAHPN